jgi:hypothetical protein
MIELSFVFSLLRQPRSLAIPIWYKVSSATEDGRCIAYEMDPGNSDDLDYVEKWCPGRDPFRWSDPTWGGAFGHMEKLTLALLIIMWLFWAGMLALNLVTRFSWWPKDYPAGLPEMKLNATCADKLTDWPFIHWIAVTAWGFTVLALLLCTAFAWLAFQSLTVTDEHAEPNEVVPFLIERLVTSIVMLILMRMLFGYFDNEWLARLFGGEMDTGCLGYRCFLLASYLPVIGLICVSIGYGRLSRGTTNASMGMPRDSFIASAGGSDFFPLTREAAGKVWDENQSVSKATLAFLILAWITTAALGIVNTLSGLGIRPAFAARIDDAQKPTAATDGNAPNSNNPQPGFGQPPVQGPPPGYNQPPMESPPSGYNQPPMESPPSGSKDPGDDQAPGP